MKLTPIYDPSEIPEFATEDEEAEFWSTHSITEELWNKLPPADPKDLPTPRRREPRERS